MESIPSKIKEDNMNSLLIMDIIGVPGMPRGYTQGDQTAQAGEPRRTGKTGNKWKLAFGPRVKNREVSREQGSDTG